MGGLPRYRKTSSEFSSVLKRRQVLPECQEKVVKWITCELTEDVGCGKSLDRRNPTECAGCSIYKRLGMSKQEEIREGMARSLRLYRLNEVEGHGDDCIVPWDECDARTRGYWLSDADDWLKYLDSLDLAIRVDRELPLIDFDDVFDIERTRLMNSASRHTVDILLKAGLVFTLPLIGEGV